MAKSDIRYKVQIHVAHRRTLDGSPRFLLLQRPPRRGSIWQPVTGKLLPGEEPREGALRELAEETGILAPESLEEVTAFEFDAGGRPCHETVYVATVAASAVTLSDEHEACDWVTASEALGLIHHASNRDALRRCLAHLGEPLP